MSARPVGNSGAQGGGQKGGSEEGRSEERGGEERSHRHGGDHPGAGGRDGAGTARRPSAAERASAERDLAFIREVVARTQRRIDPHAFHFVHWGAIVLVWFPVGNWLQAAGRLDLLAALGIAAVVTGSALSGWRELRLRQAARLPAQETFVATQVSQVTLATIVAGIVLSALAPATGFVDGEDVPILWGLSYSALAYMIGVVYERDFRIAGVVIFAGTLLAIGFQPYAGYILGPFMGLGLILPGLRAERRVRRLAGGGGGVVEAEAEAEAEAETEAEADTDPESRRPHRSRPQLEEPRGGDATPV